MLSLRSSKSSLFAVIVVLLTAASAGAADWPTYRHDNARTGCTTESLSLPLTLRWVYTPAHDPRPAWPPPAARPREGFYLRHRVNFDDAFQVAAAGEAVYFGSSSDNKVYAIDAATGGERWSFFTGGPVRLAPTISNDCVFVGSDDGFAYCLNVGSGQLIWKVRPGPNDERLLGSGKMISRWPLRTNILLDDGVAYLTAGIFPHENVYICAVKADDGTVIWRNDSVSEQGAYRNELSPQGYLLSAGNHLFVPSGRALPAAFDRQTGQFLFKSSYGWRGEQAGGVVGGTYALLADDQIYTGSQNHLLALDQNRGRAGFGWFPGRRLAVVGDMAYMATGKEIVAMDRVKYAELSRRRNALEYALPGLRSKAKSAKGDELEKRQEQLKAAEQELNQLVNEKIAAVVKWRVPTASDAELILCENLVFAGGAGRVEAFDREKGDAVWNAKVDGKARGLAVANDRLLVSTDTGRIYCFASQGLAEASAPRLARPAEPPAANPYPQDELTAVYKAAAEAIVMESGVNRGYCPSLEPSRAAWLGNWPNERNCISLPLSRTPTRSSPQGRRWMPPASMERG